MNKDVSPPAMTHYEAGEKLQYVRAQINNVLIGQQDVVEQVLTAMVASGHVLLEGVPGLGKTLLVQAFAACINGHYKRIQFTPDLMPADITGHALYDMHEGRFRIRRGPAFTNLLLADEINRAPAKTQAALLEVMQENQVTIEGESIKLSPPFMVLATQNPIEQDGTYPLPEAELDRFLLKIDIDYPSQAHEVDLTRQVVSGYIDHFLTANSEPAILSGKDINQLQQLCTSITVDNQVIDYAVRLARATRESVAIVSGAGPRASIGMVRAAQARALIRGADFVLPDDIKSVALPVMRHRIILAADVEIEGQTPDSILSHLLATVETPRL